MMKVDQFCRIAEDIARNYRTQYRLGGIGEHNGDLWYFDCVGLIKSIIWGWCGNTNYSRGGAVYASNGLPDVGANKLFEDYCYDKSTDFTKIEKGELVWMDGHIGIYIKDGIIVPVPNGRQVAEATAAWDNKVLISDLGMNGERSSNGRQVYRWTHHGKFKFIDYSAKKPFIPKYEEGTTVVVNGWCHKTTEKDSESTGEYHDFVSEIIKIEKYECEYPYEIRNAGWCREKYITPYIPPKEEPVEKPVEKVPDEPKPIEPPKEEKQLTIWEKLLQMIIDILNAILERINEK